MEPTDPLNLRASVKEGAGNRGALTQRSEEQCCTVPHGPQARIRRHGCCRRVLLCWSRELPRQLSCSAGQEVQSEGCAGSLGGGLCRHLLLATEDLGGAPDAHAPAAQHQEHNLWEARHDRRVSSGASFEARSRAGEVGGPAGGAARTCSSFHLAISVGFSLQQGMPRHGHQAQPMARKSMPGQSQERLPPAARSCRQWRRQQLPLTKRCTSPRRAHLHSRHFQSSTHDIGQRENERRVCGTWPRRRMCAGGDPTRLAAITAPHHASPAQQGLP